MTEEIAKAKRGMIGALERKRIKKRVRRVEVEAESRFDNIGQVVQSRYNSLGGTISKEE